LPRLTIPDMEAPLIIAHRTSPAYAPENSLFGIRVTFEQGADGVEIDLRASLDLQSFLMHDNSMWRTTGWPLPIELTPSAVVRKRRLRPFATPRDEAGGVPPQAQGVGDGSILRDESGGNGRGAGDGAMEGVPVLRDESLSSDVSTTETVPTLAEAIDATPEGKIFAVDLKTPWAAFDLVRTIRARGMQSRTLVWCSSAQVVRYVRRGLPDVEVAYYKDYEDGPYNIEFIGKAARIGAKAVSLDWRGINRDVVTTAHALGLKVYSWHKEHPITAEKIASGLDGVITDHPARSREQIGKL
jgi:glycerophosphoryl diester phosphodiesterase